MPPKKGGGKKKGKKDKVDKDKLTQVDRTFYELTITDLNNKLSRLRSHLAKTDEINEDLTEKLRHLNEDRTDVTAHLDRTLVEKVETIHELDERLTELSKVRDSETLSFTEKIKEWETKYKSMHEQLTSEIKLLNGKLNSLEEFRVQRDTLLAKFDEQEQALKEHQRMHKEAMYEMENKAMIEKDALKKEVQNKLLQLSEDFTRSSEIRNAGYTRRLIRENIALTKEIGNLIKAQLKMMEEHSEMKAKTKSIVEEFKANEEMKRHLILTCQNKIEIIEQLTSSYEKLKIKFINLQKYRQLYETSVKRDICDRFTYNDLSNKLRILKQRVDTLKNEKVKLIGMHQQHEVLIINLREIIKTIRHTVQVAIDEQQPIEGVSRKNLLCELLAILASYSETPEGVKSVETMSSEISTYRPGKMGFLQRSASSLVDIFKREARKIASAERISPEFKQKKLDGKILPKARSVEGDILVDVEYGSTYYMSSSADELGIPDEEEKVEDDEGADYGSSSTGESNISTHHSQHSHLSIDRKLTKDLSTKSSELIDEASAVSEEAPEEEVEDDEESEGEDEDEDSINLFY
ncbi:cilia- and flagella-associated protein 157 [Eupeodes corollae]|uniref:cilia- and flagella-associated protein 157 n=1 Tax=Eupeodes corollae TaxID=290404 RepID=UPI00248FF30A|nr:cilia- and flagella-associated protein 157 [Eupeodes corollae]